MTYTDSLRYIKSSTVCRVAQEAGAQHREYIDRKKENVIFAPPWLCAAFIKHDDFCCGHAHQFQYSTPNFSEIASSIPEIYDFKN